MAFRQQPHGWLADKEICRLSYVGSPGLTGSKSQCRSAPYGSATMRNISNVSKYIKMEHAGRTFRDYLPASGISNIKLAPTCDTGRVKSACNCFANAATSRLPSFLLVVGSKPCGRPTPLSRTDNKIMLLSDFVTRTQIKPSEQFGYAYLPEFETSSLTMSPTRMARSAAKSIFSGAS